MVPFRALLLAPLTLLISAAAPPSREVVIGSQAGQCTLLVIANRTATPACGGKLVTLTYGKQAVSIVFTAQDGRLLSFRGVMAAKGSGQDILKVQRITTVSRNPSPAIVKPAGGTCMITAFSPTRDRIECSAKAPGTQYAGQFITSGT